MTTMQLGVFARLEAEPDMMIANVRGLGFPTCQVSCGNVNLLDHDYAEQVRAIAAQNDVTMTTLWAGSRGHNVWDFLQGPVTIGLVPPDRRAEVLQRLKQAADFARVLGVPSITSHVGFIPENPSDPLYPGVLAALQEISLYCQARGLGFWFETGQETPITLLRALEDIGTENVGINLDPANLLMYGKANPVDALDTFGRYVRGVHAKDGEYPTNGRKLGVEKPLGEGRVDFPRLLAKLKALGYDGALTIEREISGPQQIEDIKQGKRFLEQLLASI